MKVFPCSQNFTEFTIQTVVVAMKTKLHASSDPLLVDNKDCLLYLLHLPDTRITGCTLIPTTIYTFANLTLT